MVIANRDRSYYYKQGKNYYKQEQLLQIGNGNWSNYYLLVRNICVCPISIIDNQIKKFVEKQFFFFFFSMFVEFACGNYKT